MVEVDNIHLYSFFNDYDLINDLSYYRDYNHFNRELASRILHWIKEGKGLITKENYKDFYQDMYLYYTNYDYEKLFQE